MNSRILVADDDPDIVLMLSDRLESLGYDVLKARDGLEALHIIEEEAPGLVLLDLEMPHLTGLDILTRLKRRAAAQDEGPNVLASGPEQVPIPPIIVMTAHATVPRAVEAMKNGAFDFLMKPLDVDHLSLVIEKALERESLKREVEYLRNVVESRYGTIVGQSPAIVGLVEMAKRAARSDATVLLLGESGTGKELFARSIHQWSERRHMPFVVINCVALTGTLLENELFGHEKGAYTGADSLQKGKIEVADGGTVFLDEIGDMPAELQAKLLRLLQDREFHRVGGHKFIRANIRVVAATNRDLKKAVKNGDFREDLFFRLNVVTLSMPPLRERVEDVPELAEFFLKRHVLEAGRPSMTITPETMNQLCQYPWPGNIRELDNAIARAVVLGTGPTLDPEHLGLATGEGEALLMFEGLPYHEAMEAYSRHIIEKTLQKAGGSQKIAADMLKLQRTYLARLVKKIRDDYPESCSDILRKSI